MKKYIIYLDFDGTVVEHTYPSMGRANFGCIEVIEKLQKAGHTVILNTMRSEFNNGSLEQALKLINEQYFYIALPVNRDKIELIPISSTEHKIDPGVWDWKQFKQEGIIYIDDICRGIPLKKCVMSHGSMVDWVEVEKELVENEVI